MARDVPSTRTSPRYLAVAWALLLLLGAFFLFAALSDLAADARTGLPSDHMGAFRSIAGLTWDAAKRSSPGITQYVTLREDAMRCPFKARHGLREQRVTCPTRLVVLP